MSSLYNAVEAGTGWVDTDAQTTVAARATRPAKLQANVRYRRKLSLLLGHRSGLGISLQQSKMFITVLLLFSQIMSNYLIIIFGRRFIEKATPTCGWLPNTSISYLAVKP